MQPIFFEKGLRMFVYPVSKGRGMSAVQQIWHIKDSQGQITALSLRSKPFRPFKLFSLDSEAVYRVQKRCGRQTSVFAEQGAYGKYLARKGPSTSWAPPLHIGAPTPPFAGFREPRNLCGVVFRRAACSPGLGFWVWGLGFMGQGSGF